MSRNLGVWIWAKPAQTRGCSEIILVVRNVSITGTRRNKAVGRRSERGKGSRNDCARERVRVVRE